MIDSILADNNTFVRFGYEHWISLAVWWSIGIIIIYLGRNQWSETQQKKYIFYFALIITATQLFKIFARLYLGTFDITTDLPLELCNIMALIMPFIMLCKWRFGWSIMFFWICAGTAQAMVTPTHIEAFPNYEALRYWAVHVGLPIIAIYGAVVYGWRVTWKDALFSAIGLNLMALVIYFANLIFDSNYMYLNAKPPGATIYSILGPWPWYILSLEGVIFILFSLLLIPFVWLSYLDKKIQKAIPQTQAID
jgi:hypothetical integral membrane protein (TIGR02206 family)|tara:strand:- start:4066 stop:4818 length:753 start_codon:yes stop_codon:yes gene_type:complete